MYLLVFTLFALCLSMEENGTVTPLQRLGCYSMLLRAKQNNALPNINGTCSPESTNESTMCVSPWSSCVNGICQCTTINDSLHGVIDCSHNARNVSLLGCHCITYNERESLTEVGNCVFFCGNPHNAAVISGGYYTLPSQLSMVNEHVCGKFFSRTGTLCGNCRPGHFPLAYSFDLKCVKCQNGRSNWWKFVLVAFLPLTIFYFIVLFFKINITSSNLYGIVLFSQTLCMPVMARASLVSTINLPIIENVIRYISIIYGIWNLDFLRSLDLGICLGTNTLQTMSLDIIVGIYPLLLMLMSYALIEMHDRNFKPLVMVWKPFGTIFGLFRQTWDIRTSVIDSFASFFLLSNMKFLSISFDLLTPIKVHQFSSTGEITHSWRLFYNASVPYFGEKHLPYAILAVVLLLLFAVFPVILLFVYPFQSFQKLINHFPCRWYILHTFMDSFQGCYKDGTEPGTRDCRWFASVFFVVRFISLLVVMYTLDMMFFSMASFLVVILVILLVQIQPFKPTKMQYTHIIATFLLLLNQFFMCLVGGAMSSGEQKSKVPPEFFLGFGAIIAILPFFYMSAICLHWLYTRRKFGLRLIGGFKVWRAGYEELQ